MLPAGKLRGSGGAAKPGGRRRAGELAELARQVRLVGIEAGRGDLAQSGAAVRVDSASAPWKRAMRAAGLRRQADLKAEAAGEVFSAAAEFRGEARDAHGAVRLDDAPVGPGDRRWRGRPARCAREHEGFDAVQAAGGMGLIGEAAGKLAEGAVAEIVERDQAMASASWPIGTPKKRAAPGGVKLTWTRWAVPQANP